MNNNRGFNTENYEQNNYSDLYHGNSDFGNNPNIQVSLPNSGAILTLGIISIVSICCCAGFVGPILSIVALALAPGAKRTYYSNPGLYTQSSFSNLKAGQTCAIIGLVVSLLSIVYFVVLFSSGSYMADFDELINEVWNQSSY
jgi:hypothetical protein